MKYMFKRLIVALSISMIIFISLPKMMNKVSAATQSGQVTATSLNVRTGPSTGFGRVLTLKKGNAVTISDQKNGWYKVKYGSKIGWTSAKYIKIAKTTTPSTATSSKTSLTGTITDSVLNVRTGPSTSYKVITSLKKGTKITILEQKNGWYKIKTSKGYGWLSGNYVKLTSTVKPPTTNSKPSTTSPKPPTISKPTNTTPSGGNSSQSNVNNGGTPPSPNPETPSPGTTTPVPSVKYGKVTSPDLNVRKGPSTSYQVIKALNIGTIVTINSEKDGWYQITSGTITGWVSVKYIQNINNVDLDLKNFVLVIDPGHGGSDPGTSFKTSSGITLKESAIVLSVSKYLKSYLVAMPIKSYFTRETDVYPSLSQRVSFAKSKQADLYLSIHINATPSHGGYGTETYYYGLNKTGSAAQKLQDSTQFADFVQKRLTEKLKLKDRGTKSGNFHVIRETSMASILTELGYIDNPADNVKLASSYWQKEAAKGIYLGILDYLTFKGYNVNSYYNIK